MNIGILQKIDNSYLLGWGENQPLRVCYQGTLTWYKGPLHVEPKVTESRETWRQREVRLQESRTGSLSHGGTP